MSTRTYYNGKVTNLEELEKALALMEETGRNVYGYNPENIEVVLKKTWTNPRHKDAFENDPFCRYASLTYSCTMEENKDVDVWFTFGTRVKNKTCTYLNSLDNLKFNIRNFQNSIPKNLITPDKSKIRYQNTRIFFGDDAHEPMQVELQIYLTNEETGLQCVIDEVEVGYFTEEQA